MDSYDLAPGEFVIMHEQSARLCEGSEEQDLQELVLTNRNLILAALVSESLFKKSRYLKHCPLDQLLCTNGLPQVSVSKFRDKHHLLVAFQGENVDLYFPGNPKRTAQRWAEGIRKAALGDLASIQTEDVLPPEIADIVDGARGVFGAFLGTKDKAATGGLKMPETVARKCQGCHAPLTGRAGSVVTCSYCDTKQTL